MKNLKRVSKELGETMTEEACSSRCLEFFDTDNSVQELREMIERADTDGDGAITPEVRPTSVCMNSASAGTVEDFYNIMTKKTFP